MDTDTLNSSSDKIVSRKNFLLAATGAAAYLGMTGRAKATGTQAYLDLAETFTADHTFGNITAGITTASGNAFFESGYPWVDVRGLKLPTDTSDDASIARAFTAAITSAAGTDATGNRIIYFPPGDYVIVNPILPPNSASNYILMGAGVWSSRISWGGSTGGSPMLKLVNARGVTIRNIGFIGSDTAAMPSYGIQIHRGAGLVGTASPTDVLVENVYLGGWGGPCLGTAIGYTAESSYDNTASGPSGYGTFRDINIDNVATAYRFGTTMAFGHNIIGGGVAGGANGIPPVYYSTAFDNTPGQYTDTSTYSPYGGSYSIFKSATGTNLLLFNIGQSNGYSLNVFGLEGESDLQLMNTPAALGTQTVQFFGGLSEANGAPNPDIVFNSNGGQLEFHGYELTSGNCHFPGSAAVAFYGGALSSTSWAFNGPLQFHGMYMVVGLEGASTFTNLGSGTLQEYGHEGRLIGIAAAAPLLSIPAINNSTAYTPGAAAGSPGASATVAGTDMAGLITLTTGSSGTTAGQLLQINFATPYQLAPNVILLPSEPNSVGVITEIYTQLGGVSSFLVKTSTALATSTIYQWSYLVMG